GREDFLRGALGRADLFLRRIDDGMLGRALLLELREHVLRRRELDADRRLRVAAFRQQLLHALSRLVERVRELAALDLTQPNPREHAQPAELGLALLLEVRG